MLCKLSNTVQRLWIAAAVLSSIIFTAGKSFLNLFFHLPLLADDLLQAVNLLEVSVATWEGMMVYREGRVVYSRTALDMTLNLGEAGEMC